MLHRKVNCSNHVWFFQTLLCGLIGLPPSNGVLPQSPMHTKSLAVLKRQVGGLCFQFKSQKYFREVLLAHVDWMQNFHLQHIRRKMIESARESIRRKASNSEIYGKMQDVFIEMESNPVVSLMVNMNIISWLAPKKSSVK